MIIENESWVRFALEAALREAVVVQCDNERFDEQSPKNWAMMRKGLNSSAKGLTLAFIDVSDETINFSRLFQQWQAFSFGLVLLTKTAE